MSVEAQVAKLEGLLERIQQKRHPLPVQAESSAEEPRRSRRMQPTPMEQALSSELETSEPELEIVMDADEDDDGPVITIVPPDEDGPEIITDDAPTAPVGTPAVSAEPAATGPSRIAARAAQPSAPVGRVVSTPQPKTFGELLDRALALRPG